jgi:two-component system, OmpR family, response regulator MprA
MLVSTIPRLLATPTFEVLVVDDDPATARMVSHSVREIALLRQVSDAYQALYELTAHRVDAVVMELFLPGASGVDLLQRMRAKGLRVPTIVLTVANRPYGELDGFGVQHVLHKPASPEQLRAALTDVLAPAMETQRLQRADRTAA